jgi:hypothetical protein
MTPRHTHQFIAFACAVLMTLTIFSGVVSLASPEHGGQGGQWLAQATEATMLQV